MATAVGGAMGSACCSSVPSRSTLVTQELLRRGRQANVRCHHPPPSSKVLCDAHLQNGVPCVSMSGGRPAPRSRRPARAQHRDDGRAARAGRGCYDPTCNGRLGGGAGQAKSAARDGSGADGTRWEPVTDSGSAWQREAAYDARRQVAVVSGGGASATTLSFEATENMGRNQPTGAHPRNRHRATGPSRHGYDEGRRGHEFGGMLGDRSPLATDKWELGRTRFASHEGPAGRGRSARLRQRPTRRALRRRRRVAAPGSRSLVRTPGCGRHGLATVAEDGPPGAMARQGRRTRGVVLLYGGRRRTAMHRCRTVAVGRTRWTDSPVGATPGIAISSKVYDSGARQEVLDGGFRVPGRTWRDGGSGGRSSVAGPNEYPASPGIDQPCGLVRRRESSVRSTTCCHPDRRAGTRSCRKR